MESENEFNTTGEKLADISAKRTENGIEINFILLKKKRIKGKKPQLILTPEGAAYIEELAGYGCTQQEIAGKIGVDVNTLKTEINAPLFHKAIEKGKNEFLTSIRVEQSRIMKKGNSNMAIFLGKVYLNQDDRPAPDTPAVSPLDQLAEELKRFNDRQTGDN